ncbi:Rsp5p-dependent ubiquitination, sorting of cargo proteins at the multivesicular body [Nowakowskiella sp. JEL0407]|nr:Rsp5p-dependent ubiquitination, sorting of cargo proteins at the multivesicular body [Nowakowskiella sp. JEL0407]
MYRLLFLFASTFSVSARFYSDPSPSSSPYTGIRSSLGVVYPFYFRDASTSYTWGMYGYVQYITDACDGANFIAANSEVYACTEILNCQQQLNDILDGNFNSNYAYSSFIPSPIQTISFSQTSPTFSPILQSPATQMSDAFVYTVLGEQRSCENLLRYKIYQVDPIPTLSLPISTIISIPLGIMVVILAIIGHIRKRRRRLGLTGLGLGALFFGHQQNFQVPHPPPVQQVVPLTYAPPPFINLEANQYQQSIQFQVQNPPPLNQEALPNQIEQIKKLGLKAWKFFSLDPNWIRVDDFNGMQTLEFLIAVPGAVATIMTDHPLWNAWKETTVLRVSPGTVFSVGFATAPYPPFRQVGLNLHSIGYHSTGQIFHSTSTPSRTFTALYTGQTIGCGYDTVTGSVYFTLNGILLGEGNLEIQREKRPYHAAVSANGIASISLNFGNFPFKYTDMENYVRENEPPPAYSY